MPLEVDLFVFHKRWSLVMRTAYDSLFYCRLGWNGLIYSIVSFGFIVKKKNQIAFHVYLRAVGEWIPM
jgi:hypothetical protein